MRLRIEHYCLERQFDVVYFSYPYLMECPRLPMAMVATLHDFNYKRFNTLGPAACAQIDRQMPEWLNRCCFLIVSSDFMDSELRRFYPEFANKVRVVRPGIPGGSRVPTELELESYWQRTGLPQRFLLNTGWIAPHKNQKVLFEALGLLRRKGINTPLVCVRPNSDQLQPGSKRRAGDYVREVLQVAKHFGLQYGRDFWGLGYVDDFEIECLYRLALMVIVPSLYEAGSFAIIEAIRAQCPVACSRIPAYIEQTNLIDNNIWLFDPFDARSLVHTLEQMLAHTEVTTERAMPAAETVGQVYSWEKAAVGYLSAFQEALKGNITKTGGER